MMAHRLLQLSGVVVDLIYEVAAVPRSGEEALVTGFSMLPGGGFNAMVAARRSGMVVSYGGSLGTGPFAEIAMKGLQGRGNPDPPAADPGMRSGLLQRHGGPGR